MKNEVGMIHVSSKEDSYSVQKTLQDEGFIPLDHIERFEDEHKRLMVPVEPKSDQSILVIHNSHYHTFSYMDGEWYSEMDGDHSALMLMAIEHVIDAPDETKEKVKKETPELFIDGRRYWYPEDGLEIYERLDELRQPITEEPVMIVVNVDADEMTEIAREGYGENIEYTGLADKDYTCFAIHEEGVSGELGKVEDLASLHAARGRPVVVCDGHEDREKILGFFEELNDKTRDIIRDKSVDAINVLVTSIREVAVEQLNVLNNAPFEEFDLKDTSIEDPESLFKKLRLLRAQSRMYLNQVDSLIESHNIEIEPDDPILRVIRDVLSGLS